MTDMETLSRFRLLALKAPVVARALTDMDTLVMDIPAMDTGTQVMVTAMDMGTLEATDTATATKATAIA